MQIVSGTWRGKKLISPGEDKVRPTSVKGREALFNALESRTSLRGKTILDVFAGTGALGLEALSRGAKHVIFTDIDLRPCKKNIHLLGVEGQSTLLQKDARSLALKDVQEADIVFMDPPYGQNLVPETLKTIAPYLKPGCFIFTETEKSFPADTLPFAASGVSFDAISQKDHGPATLTLLKKL